MTSSIWQLNFVNESDTALLYGTYYVVNDKFGTGKEG
jgi:hypothetical protein